MGVFDGLLRAQTGQLCYILVELYFIFQFLLTGFAKCKVHIVRELKVVSFLHIEHSLKFVNLVFFTWDCGVQSVKKIAFSQVHKFEVVFFSKFWLDPVPSKCISEKGMNLLIFFVYQTG